VQPAAAQVPYIDVGLKDDRASSGGGIPAAYFLEAQIEGGRRRIKGFEKMLQASGHMPQGWRAVPGKFARIDAFGNMSRGQLIQIVSQLRVTPLSGTTRNKSTEGLARLKSELKQGGQYFALPNGRGKLPPGVYLAPLQANASTRFKKTDRFTYRQANQLRMVERQAPQPVLIFVRNTDYRQRYDFWGVAERTYNARAPQILGAVLDSINKG
jgi:muconolactone delta-isomerase